MGAIEIISLGVLLIAAWPLYAVLYQRRERQRLRDIAVKRIEESKGEIRILGLDHDFIYDSVGNAYVEEPSGGFVRVAPEPD